MRNSELIDCLDEFEARLMTLETFMMSLIRSFDEQTKEKVLEFIKEEAANVNEVFEAEAMKNVISFDSSEEKREWFEKNYPFSAEKKPDDDTVYTCLHCNQQIRVGDFKAVEGLICCPNYPDCDGTVIDWIKL